MLHQKYVNRSIVFSSTLQKGNEFRLQDKKFSVVKGSTAVLPTQIRKVGLYMVVTVKTGVVVMWDQKTSLFIKLCPDYQVNMLLLLCGFWLYSKIIHDINNNVFPGRVKCVDCVETMMATAKMISLHAPMKLLQMF